MRLIIIGAGGYGHTVRDIAGQSGKYESIFFVDDNLMAENSVGKCDEWINFNNGETQFYPAFGNNELRMAWINRLYENGVSATTIIHPSSYISPEAVIEYGCVVMPNAIVNTNCTVKRGCIINCASIIDHGCEIGEGSHICLGAIIKAENKIPPLTKIEAGTVIQNRFYK